ncbi:MAG: 3'-5' exonuclease [Pseudomonadota bacterium]
MVPVLAFDIETIPDTAGLAKLYALPPDTPADEVAEIAFQRRRVATGSDFLQLHVHRVLVISCALRSDEGFRVWSLSGEDEAANVQRFFDGIEKYTPQLVSWNGGGFDLPVLHYRAMVHGISAPRYWDMGEDDRDFKWNNYLSRYHSRHLDLMDLLALYQPRANVGLDDLSKLVGFPGKLGMDGAQVWPAYRRGETEAIRDYCETDAVNTYLLYMRFQLLRGQFTPERYRQECEIVRAQLTALDLPHWQEFLAAWP